MATTVTWDSQQVPSSEGGAASPSGAVCSSGAPGDTGTTSPFPLSNRLAHTWAGELGRQTLSQDRAAAGPHANLCPQCPPPLSQVSLCGCAESNSEGLCVSWVRPWAQPGGSSAGPLTWVQPHRAACGSGDPRVTGTATSGGHFNSMDAGCGLDPPLQPGLPQRWWLQLGVT